MPDKRKPEFFYGYVVVAAGLIASALIVGPFVSFGVILFVGTFGSLISPMLAGRIFDIMGNYQLAFWINFAFSVVGLILISLLRPTSSRGGTNES